MDNNLPSEEVDKVVNTWIDTLKIPTVSGGYVVEDGNFLNVSTVWSVVDPGKKETVKFQKNFSILNSSLKWDQGETFIDETKLVMCASSPTPIDGKMICVSKNGQHKAILMEKATSPEKEPKSQFLQIWNGNTLLKCYDLLDLDKHKSVYTCGEFGNNMIWDDDGEKLAYLAEKKVPKPKPFFVSDVQKDNENGNGEETNKNGPRGEEYALRQTWGEQMNDMYFSVIVILDTKTDTFNVIELPSNQFPTDLQWVGKSTIIGTSYIIPEWRLGLIYCTNRESRIFSINIDGSEFDLLSSNDRAAFCPRVRPDGKFVIWQERAVDEPHNRARNIMGISIGGNKESPKSIYQSVPPNLPIYQSFPKNCWTRKGDGFFVVTPKDGITSLIFMSLKDNNTKVDSTFILDSSPGVDAVLWIGEKFLLIARSSTLCSPFIELVEIDGNRRAAITHSINSNPKWSIKKVYGKASIPSFFVGPENAESRVPLIVWVHGGPHSCFTDSFMHESVFLSKLGYSFLKVNYIGSLGGTKRDETDDCLGKIGTLDVEDSQNIVEKAIKEFACIDNKQVGVWGGSYGGFLTCHLISQYPDSYRCGVARNPVCDLNVMTGTSDITDWLYAEVGIPFPVGPNKSFIPAAQSIEETEKCFKASPISRASSVKAATLFCLGKEDLRVPMAQGMAFYRALKAHGKTTDVRVYPDCHPLSTVPVRIDNVIHCALWFKKYIKK